jgi:hypothetical protein
VEDSAREVRTLRGRLAGAEKETRTLEERYGAIPHQACLVSVIQLRLTVVASSRVSMPRARVMIACVHALRLLK